MKITREASPYDFLMNDSWECEILRSEIQVSDVDREAFDEFVETSIGEECTETTFNDFLRFNEDEILEYFGLNKPED